MSGIEPISVPGNPAPAGPYSPAVRAGDFVFLAGQTARRPEGGIAEGAEEQSRQAMANLDRVARAAGGTLADAVKVTVYLADLAWKATFDAVYAETPGLRAARTTVQGAPPNGSVEVDAILYLPRA